MDLTGNGSTLTAGTDSSNAGQIELPNASSLSFAEDFENNSTINLGIEGTVSVSGTLDNYGTIGSGLLGKLSAGVIDNYGGIQLGIDSFISAGSINNSGAVSFDSFGGINTSGDFNNNGGVVLPLSTFMNVGGNFNNHGSLSLTGSETLGTSVDVSAAFNNYSDGTVEIQGAHGNGRLDVGGQFANAGVVTVDPGGALNANGGFLNSGNVNVVSVGHGLGQATLSANWFTNTGNVLMNFNGGILNVTGTFNNTGGTVSLVGPTSLCTGCGGDTLSAGSFNNSGNVTIGGSETITVTNTYTQTGGSTTIQPNGALAAALFTQKGGIVQVDGTLTAAGLTQSSGPGLLMGRGIINGNVSIGGTIMPGVMGDPGVFTINGSYTQTSSGAYNELINNAGNGLLMVNGPATLGPGSKLFVTLLGGFDPAPGTNYTILDYSSESGTLVITDPIFNNGTERWVITSYNGGGSDDIVLTAENNPTPTPEPASFVLLATGIAMMAIFMRYRSSARPSGPSGEAAVGS